MPRAKFVLPSIDENIVHEYLDEQLREDPEIIIAGMTRIIKMARLHFKQGNGRSGYSQDSLRAACLSWIDEHSCIVGGPLSAISMSGVHISEEHKQHISNGWKRLISTGWTRRKIT